MTIRVRSFAKINLGLRIGGARPDGFHELLTIYQTIGLHDRIRVSIERGRGIEIRCDDPRVPRDDSNTCYRIVERAMPALRAKGRVVIDIEKRLPVQGGLGGASANAVTTLLGLERALRKRLPLAEKLRIAAEVGSDLPLFLVGGAVLGMGRGEQVYPLPDFPATPCVVVTPEIGVSTPRAFAEWDRRQGLKPRSMGAPDTALKGRSSTEAQAATTAHAVGETRDENPNELCQDWAAESVDPHTSSPKLTGPTASDRINRLGCGLSARLSEAFFGRPYSSAPSGFLKERGRAGNPLLWLVRAGIENDFEQVVFPENPKLRAGKRALERAGAKYASLSGSGSTLYGLFGSREAVQQAARRLREQGWTAQATVTLPRRQYWSKIFD